MRRSAYLKEKAWVPRNMIIANLIKEIYGPEKHGTLLDIGCGTMTLKKAIQEVSLTKLEYICADLFPRDSHTIVVDLDRDNILEKLPRADIVVISGVIEYFKNFKKIFRDICQLFK